MAPSSSRKTITRPLRMRPRTAADFETGTVSGIADMSRSVRDCDVLLLGRTGGAKSDRGVIIFLKFCRHAAGCRASGGRDACGYGGLRGVGWPGGGGGG